MNGSSAPLPKILLIEDSSHFQNLVSLLVQQHLPDAQIHIANDGISGLAKFGQIQPNLLLVDILLPGIDGAALITSLRSDPQFSRSRLVIITGLSETEMSPYAFALEGLPVIRKPNLVKELIPTLNELLGQAH
jgi:CheY-like chemotaxis protein